MAEKVDCSPAEYREADGETFVCRECSSICSPIFQDPFCKKKCPNFIPPSEPEAGGSTSSYIVEQSTSYADVEQSTSYADVGQSTSSVNVGASVGFSVGFIVIFIVLIALWLLRKKLPCLDTWPLCKQQKKRPGRKEASTVEEREQMHVNESGPHVRAARNSTTTKKIIYKNKGVKKEKELEGEEDDELKDQSQIKEINDGHKDREETVMEEDSDEYEDLGKDSARYKLEKISEFGGPIPDNVGLQKD